MQLVQSYHIDRLDKDEVLRYLGYGGQQMSAGLDARLDQAMSRVLELARPQGCMRVYPVAEPGDAPGAAADARSESEAEAGSSAQSPVDNAPAASSQAIHLAGCSLVLRGKSICKHLRDARQVGVLAVTLGAAIDRELTSLGMISALDQLFFDAAATACIERTADVAENDLVAFASSQHLYTNARFSPGYGDLPLDTQRPLLACVDAQRGIGLGLLSSNLLVPTKSVTAVVGMFETAQKTSHLSCGTCFCNSFCTIRQNTGKTCYGFDTTRH